MYVYSTVVLQCGNMHAQQAVGEEEDVGHAEDVPAAGGGSKAKRRADSKTVADAGPSPRLKVTM